MKMPVRNALVGALLIACTACSITKPSFSSQATPNVDLSTYRTYAWESKMTPVGVASPLTYQRTYEELDASFKRAGFQEVPMESADMILAYALDGGFGSVEMRNPTQSTMRLDIYDAKTRQPVWSGVAEKKVGIDGASDELITHAADGLVSRFRSAASKGK